MTPTSPGWYPDPQGTGGERWFDGTTWSTDNVRPAQPPVPPRPPADYGQQGYGQQSYGQPAYGAPMPPPVPGYATPQATASNKLSIIGLVCGVLGFFVCAPLFGIAAIVLGVIGRRNGERLGIWSIVVGAVALVLGVLAAVLVVSLRK